MCDVECVVLDICFGICGIDYVVGCVLSGMKC